MCKGTGPGGNESCCICLGVLGAETSRLGCGHRFCSDCILRNARYSNRCPYCRSEFSFVEAGGVMVDVMVDVEPHEPEDDDEPCYVCMLNNDFDRLLECDLCEAAYCHTYCDPRLVGRAVPQGEWFCEDCEMRLRELQLLR